MDRIGVELRGALAHRDAGCVITLVDAQGLPLADRELSIEQKSHDFGFGNIGFDFIGLVNGEAEADPDSPFGGASPSTAAALVDGFFEIFNRATLPFYWRGFEPERGRPDTERLRRTAEWIREHGAIPKGHPLAWHTLAPEWLRDLDTDEVEEALRSRIIREVTDFAGLVDMWDAINEVVIMPVFDKEDNGITRLCRKLGRVETVRLAFETARGANPGATLLLNDFNMSASYERLIEECLEAGIRIDALGLQSHMHQGYWGEERTLEVLERFARFGLPLHMTETTLLSGDLMPSHIVDLNDWVVEEWPSTPEGLERQAEEVVRHYTTLLSHPAVESITYWGYTDAGAWLGAPVGLVYEDGTPKPSFDALRGLVKGEWWLAPTSARTDAQGRIEVHGMAGEYEVRAGEAHTGLHLDGEEELLVTL